VKQESPVKPVLRLTGECQQKIGQVIGNFVNPVPTNPISPPQNPVNPNLHQLPLKTYHFDVITVDRNGKEINSQRKSAQYFEENLGNGVILEMVYIPAGSFMMGSNEYDNEKPIHKVTFKEPFFMGKYPVTNEQYKQIIGSSPSPKDFNAPKQPVVYVSWEDAKKFCDHLSQITQKFGREYSLTTEAQWEYACRAGTDTTYYFGNTITDKLANFNSNEGKTTEVGKYPYPNSFGLYDMHGNVWEWCEDHWHGNYKNAPDDGTAWGDTEKLNNYKMIHGGSWNGLPQYCRCADRGRNTRDNWVRYGGFRLVFSPFRT
jgi:formylglycine-generating enzyme required for sulfatase activity